MENILQKKFPNFFNYSRKEKASVPLAAFSYLECIRLILNTDKILDTTHLDEIKSFLKLLYEKNNGKLKYFKRSNEIRANSLNLIRCLQKKYSDPEYNDIYSSIKKSIKRHD